VEILVLVRELVFLALTLAVVWFVLGMGIRATLGIRAQRFYNTGALLPINTVLLPIMFLILVALELRFSLGRKRIFLALFADEPKPLDPRKQENLIAKIEDLRFRWLDAQVDAGRAEVAKGFRAKDRSFFANFATISERELRLGCKVAIACGYQVPVDLEKKMRLGLPMRLIKRIATAF